MAEARYEAAVCAWWHEDLQVVARLRKETCGYANHESTVARDHLGLAAKQNADLMNHVKSAKEKISELEQQWQKVSSSRSSSRVS